MVVDRAAPRRAASLLLAGLLAGGCASTARKPPPERGVPPPTVVGYPERRDPLMRINRAVFAFNHVAYRFLLIPLSKGYNKAVPAPARRSVARFFHNLYTPLYAANHLLQLKPKAAGRSLARFVVNSTAGLGGLFDPARAWPGYEREEAHLKDTLARYGVGYGAYLVLPIAGPSDLREGLSILAEAFASPIPYLLGEPESSLVRAFDSFQVFAPYAETYETLRSKSEDPYTFFRNLHLQGLERDADY